jgi:hypothetical protein
MGGLLGKDVLLMKADSIVREIQKGTVSGECAFEAPVIAE